MTAITAVAGQTTGRFNGKAGRGVQTASQGNSLWYSALQCLRDCAVSVQAGLLARGGTPVRAPPRCRTIQLFGWLMIAVLFGLDDLDFWNGGLDDLHVDLLTLRSGSFDLVEVVLGERLCAGCAHHATAGVFHELPDREPPKRKIISEKKQCFAKDDFAHAPDVSGPLPRACARVGSLPLPFPSLSTNTAPPDACNETLRRALIR